MSLSSSSSSVKRRKSQSSATILIDGVMEYYTCPICHNDIVQAHTTRCGHNFCETCIKACLNRKNICPICSVEAKPDQLIRNHHLDGVITKLHQVRELDAQGYAQKLMNNRLKSFHNNGANAKEGPIVQIFSKVMTQMLIKFEDYYQEIIRNYNCDQLYLQDEMCEQISALIPSLVNVNKELKNNLQKKIKEYSDYTNNVNNNNSMKTIEKSNDKKDSLLPMNSLEQMFLEMFDIEMVSNGYILHDLLMESKENTSEHTELIDKRIEQFQKHIKNFEEYLKKNSQQLMLTTNTLNEISSKLSTYISQMSSIQEKWKKCWQSLFVVFEQYMQMVPPSHIFLPLVVTIRLRGRRQFWEMQLKSIDSIRNVIEMIEIKFEQMGDPIEKWLEHPQSLEIIDQKDEKGSKIITDLNRCVQDFHLKTGTTIQVLTSFVLKSEIQKACFTFTYIPNTNQKSDYFRCQTCQFNWICQPCANQCHKGHELIPFMKDHIPSYACCNCVKQKTCKIDNIRSKGLEQEEK